VDSTDVLLTKYTKLNIGGAPKDIGFETLGAFRIKPNDGTTEIVISENYVDAPSYQVSGTSVIDSSRNLTNIGSITASGLNLTNSVGDTSLIVEADSDNNVETDNPYIWLKQDSKLVTGSIQLVGANNQDATGSVDNGMLIQARGAASTPTTIAFAVGGTAEGQSGGQTDGTVRLLVKSTGANVNGSLEVGATTVIDSSRNLTNIGTGSFSGTISFGTSWDEWMIQRGNMALRSDGNYAYFTGANGFYMAGFSNLYAANLVADFGSVQIGGTTVIDSSRNLTNIGTGSFSGSLKVNGGVNNLIAYSTSATDQPGLFAADNDSFATATSVLYAKLYGSGINATAFGQTLGNWGVLATDGSSNNGLLVGTFGSKPIIFGTGSQPRLTIDSSGNVNINSGNLQMNGTTVIDSSRNLTNIGTISSGTITSDGDLLPATDNTGNVGTAANTWSNGDFTNFLVRSVLSVRGAIDLADSDYIRMGSSDDWRLFYNGSTNKAQIEMESACLGLQITNNGTEIAYIEKATGNATFTGDVTAYSDARLKDNVETLDGSKVLEMRGVSFTKNGSASSGVIAQELEKVAPELVHTSDDEIGTKSVAYGNLVGYLIENAKQQQKEIDELKALVKTLMEK
jgi:hypothetical protein